MVKNEIIEVHTLILGQCRLKFHRQNGLFVIIIDNILRIDSITDSNITIFLSNLFNIERFYKTEKLNGLECKEYNVKSGEDIVINGLGFIKVTTNCSLKIYVLKGVKTYIRESLI